MKQSVMVLILVVLILVLAGLLYTWQRQASRPNNEPIEVELSMQGAAASAISPTVRGPMTPWHRTKGEQSALDVPAITVGTLLGETVIVQIRLGEEPAKILAMILATGTMSLIQPKEFIPIEGFKQTKGEP